MKELVRVPEAPCAHSKARQRTFPHLSISSTPNPFGSEMPQEV